jgi:hypothetical protein
VFVWKGLYILQPNDRAVLQLLGSYIGLEHGAGEVHRAARLAEHYEGSTRAVLKVLGRGALVLVGSLMSLAGWMLTGIVWLWATLLGVVALTRGLARWVWPRRPAQTRSL